MTPLGPARGALVVAAGGVLGALARWLLAEAWLEPTTAFPWHYLAVNVVGSALLAALPLVAVVRQHAWLPLFLGTGVLGGFTTMSTASTQTAALLDGGHVTTALLYAGATLVAALVAVALVDRLGTPDERHLFELEEGDL